MTVGIESKTSEIIRADSFFTVVQFTLIDRHIQIPIKGLALEIACCSSPTYNRVNGEESQEFIKS